MLPSSGYFKNLHCPYYKSGFCCRPHCHYKHAHSTSATSYTTSSTKATYVPTPINRNIPEYKPTPIAELRKRKVGESKIPNEPIVKLKKEPVSDNDNDFISSIIGSSKVNSCKVKVKEGNSKSNNNNNCKKEKSSKVLGVSKSSKTKSQLIAEKEEELRKRKSSKDLCKSDSSRNSDSSCDGKQTKESKKCSPVKSSSLKSSSNDRDKKPIVSPSIKLDESSPFLSLSSSSSTPISDSNRKSPTKQSSLSDNRDDDLAKLLESPPVDDDLVVLSVAKKPRVAHSGPSELTLKMASNKKPMKVTPSQAMYNRFNNITNNKEPTVETSTTDLSGKKRIAHNIVPKSSQISNSQQKPTPIVPSKKRPIIPAEFGGKIPMAVRTRYLNSLIDELLKFCSEDESYSRGVTEEKTIYSRSTSKNVYLNLAVNAIKRIRNEANAKSTNNSSNQQVISKVPDQSTIASIGNRPVSHTMILNGPHAEGCSIEKRRLSISVQDLTDVQLYTALKRYIMSASKLTDYGYPRPDPLVKGNAILPPGDVKCKNNFATTRRICYRCMKTFIVDEFGYPVNLESCIYHSGRLWNERFNRSIEKKYSCCKGDLTTGGCCSGKSHVVDGHCHPNFLLGYVQTQPKSPDSNGFYGIYALDCEMSYTTVGLELTRVSVIDHKLKCVYESLVKPDNPVLDYNTKFSGIKEGDLDEINVSLKDVHEKLLSLIGDKTILIGHSLESDLKALKIIHDTVIDTAEVFPHRRGLPYKRALRTLMAEFMQSIIQNDVDGHDSQEDAVACMKLILWKVSQDLSKIKR